jgi:hypothetical protein
MGRQKILNCTVASILQIQSAIKLLVSAILICRRSQVFKLCYTFEKLHYDPVLQSGNETRTHRPTLFLVLYRSDYLHSFWPGFCNHCNLTSFNNSDHSSNLLL